MSHRKWIVSSLILVTLFSLAAVTVYAGSPAQKLKGPDADLGTSFTYQGQLNLDGQPVTAICDFQFSLYEDAQGDSQVGSTQTVTETSVTGGLFTTQLDFGVQAFQGDARWLGIQVQCQGDTAYADLGLQALTAAPYALYALGASWDGLSGVPSGFADGVDDVSTVVSGTAIYTGEGLSRVTGSDAVTLSLAASYRLPQSCANGQIAEWDGAAWLCGDDDSETGGGSGDITAVHAGYGLTGGGETGDVTLAVLTGTVQQRVTGVCGSGFAVQRINADGSVVCDVDDDTTYTAGAGLALTGTSFSVLTDTVQQRVGGACGGGYAIRAINADGTVTCELVTGGGGDITAVYPGEGLTGGGNSADVTVTVAFSGTGTQSYVARADHDHDGTYADVGHTHPGADIISPVSEAISATRAITAGDADALEGENGAYYRDWTNLTNVPAGFADGSDADTTYSAGTGLALAGTTFSITPTYRLPQACANDQIAIWDGAAWTCADDEEDYWALGGNSAITYGVHYLGTSNEVSLTLAVSGTPGLRLAPSAGTPNLIGGSEYNTMTAGIEGAVIGGGGDSNFPNGVMGDYATVSGGWGNVANAYATVGGGAQNTAGGASTISGGSSNIANGTATIGGGVTNSANGNNNGAVIGGGWFNNASGGFSAILGGAHNTASGGFSTIVGGQQNTAQGGYSFAAGLRAQANNEGCFVWGDATNSGFVSCDVDNAFIIRASGGVTMYTNASLTSGMYIAPSGSSWNSVSDRERKENFAPVDTLTLLENLAAMPISTWNYKAQDPNIRHIGPMAQDFNALLPELGGEGQRYINTLDADGVALAAIQGLYHRLEEQETRIATLEAENAAQQAQIDDLETRLSALEHRHSGGASPNQAHFLPGVGLLLGGLGLWFVRRKEDQ